MSAAAIGPMLAVPEVPVSATRVEVAGDAFAGALKAAAAKGPDELRTAATQLVSTAFILPLLSSLHQSPFMQEGPFAPGKAEKRFAPLLDEKLADGITRSSKFTLVDGIVRRLSRPQAAPTQSNNKEPFLA
jgi:Rod binding domain-containing protein